MVNIVVMPGSWLYLIILKVFSSLYGTMILWDQIIFCVFEQLSLSGDFLEIFGIGVCFNEDS